MSHILDIKTYNPDMTINGKKVAQVFSIYPRLQERNEFTMTLYALEENGKQGLYRASEKGLVEVLPCEYNKFKLHEADDNNIYIHASNPNKTVPFVPGWSTVLFDIFHYDIFSGKNTLVTTDVSHTSADLCVHLPHLVIAVHGDKSKTIFHSKSAKVLYRNIDEITKLSIDALPEGFYLFKKESTDNGKQDRLIKFSRDSTQTPYDRCAEEIKFFLTEDNQLVLAFKDNGQFSFQKINEYGRFIDLNTQLNIRDLIQIKQEIKNNPKMDYSDWHFMEKMQKQHIENAPQMLIVVQNKVGKKALASLDKELKYKTITPYIFDELKYKSTQTPEYYQYEFLTDDQEDTPSDFWGLNPIEVEFEATKDGKTQDITYYAELNKVKKTGSHQSMWLYNNIQKEGYTPLRPFTPRKPKAQPVVSDDIESDLPF